MNNKIKPIHNFGPKVGQWTVHPTVAETIARERKRLKELDRPTPNVMPIRKTK